MQKMSQTGDDSIFAARSQFDSHATNVLHWTMFIPRGDNSNPWTMCIPRGDNSNPWTMCIPRGDNSNPNVRTDFPIVCTCVCHIWLVMLLFSIVS